eukprot:731465-Amphidinium_carterae.1
MQGCQCLGQHSSLPRCDGWAASSSGHQHFGRTWSVFPTGHHQHGKQGWRAMNNSATLPCCVFASWSNILKITPCVNNKLFSAAPIHSLVSSTAIGALCPHQGGKAVFLRKKGKGTAQ